MRFRLLLAAVMAAFLSLPAWATQPVPYPLWSGPADPSQAQYWINYLAGTINQGSSAPSAAGALSADGSIANSNIVYATKSKGAVSGALCTWDGATGHDVGDCINGAIAQAATNGGGTVVVPAGTFYAATPMTNHTNGVHFLGAGVGPPRYNNAANFVAATRIVWNGAGGATEFDDEPTPSVTGNDMFMSNVDGIAFDCNATANICAKFGSVSFSRIRIGVAEPRSIGFWATSSVTTSPGMQNDDIWVYARCTATSDSFHPTCALFDGGDGGVLSGQPPNVSYNRIHDLLAWGNSGDALVVGYADNLYFDDIRVFDSPLVASYGRQVVIANTAYVMPNGVSVFGVSGFPGDIHIKHSSAIVQVLGTLTGATITAAGGNTGTGAYAPATVTTTAQANVTAVTLTVGSVTNVIGGDDISCPTGVSGIGGHGGVDHYYVLSASGSTIFLGQQVNARAVANGSTCTTGFRPTYTAVNGGTYTLSSNGSTYTLSAPAGGNTQSGISLANGNLSFNDMVIPWGGTANNGDTWTIVLPNPSTYSDVEGIDVGNAGVYPGVEPGATAFANSQRDLQPTWYTKGGIPLCVSSWAQGGPCNTATGSLGFVVGSNQIASGQFSGALGNNSNATNVNSWSIGRNNTSSGIHGFVHGFAAIDRGRYGSEVWANGTIANNGDAQLTKTVLRGTTSTSSAARLTADGNGGSNANCVNIPTNTAMALRITLMAFDHTTPANNEAWFEWAGLMTRGASNAAVSMASTPTPITNGTVTGSSIAATADTGNQCLNLSFTPPTSNTDKWNAVAIVETTDVQ